MAYNDEQKANALAVLKAEGGNLTRAEEITGITRLTLRRWWRALPDSETLITLTSKKVDDLAALMESEIRAALGPGLEQARDEASYKDRVTAAAILTDKVQLLRGQPTEVSRVENVRHEPTPDGASVAARILQRRGVLN
jgi:transposase-like protein